MTTPDLPHTNRAGALRRDFDRTFAEPPRTTEDVENLLALRLGGDPYAVRLADITGLLAAKSITSLPTAVPEFLGIAGLRGSVVPVWSLAALLGHGAAGGTPRWLMLVADGAAGQLLGLAFEQFDGHLRARRSDLSTNTSAQPGAGARLHVRQSLRVTDTLRGVLCIESVVEGIRQRLGLGDHKDGPRDR